MLLINEHTLTNKVRVPKVVPSIKESAKPNSQSSCARTARCPSTSNLDVRVHPDVCPSLLLPDPGAFIPDDSEKLAPYPAVALLGWIGARLDCMGPAGLGLGWVGCGWVGCGWVGCGWVGARLDLARLDWGMGGLERGWIGARHAFVEPA